MVKYICTGHNGIIYIYKMLNTDKVKMITGVYPGDLMSR